MTLVCHHVNIVQLVGVVEFSSSLSPCIVTVFYKLGSIYDHIIRPHKTGGPTGTAGHHGLICPERLAQWALEAARGVSHLHQEGLIHRDLATRNLLLVSVY